MRESKGPEEQSADKKAESLVRRIINKGRDFCRALWNRKWKKALVSLAGFIVLIAAPTAYVYRAVSPLVPGLVEAVKGIPVTWPQGKPLDLNELKRRAVIAVTTKHRKEIESEKNLQPQYLLQLGNAERSFGNYSEAKRYYGLGLERAEEQEKQKNEKNAFLKLLDRLRGLWKPGEAQKDEKNEAAALFNLASLQLDKTEDLDEALRNVRRALDIHQKEGMKEDMANDLALLGEILSKNGEYRKAIGILKEAMKQYQESGEFGRVVDMRSAIGEAYLGVGNLDAALDDLKTARKLHKAAQDKRGWANDLFLLGTIYRRQNKGELALTYFRKARKIFSEQHSEEEGKALFHMGSIYFDMGEPDRALDALKQTAGLLKDAKLEAYCNYHIGLILKEQGGCETGLQHMKKALQMSKDNGDPALEAQALHHIGVTKSKMGRFQQALDSLDQARSAHNRNDDKHGEALDLLESGIVLRNMGKYYEAVGCFQTALMMFRETGYSDGGGARALGYLSLISADRGDYEQALRKGWNAYKMSEAMSNWKNAAERMLDLALVYRARGELDFAEERVASAERLYRGYQSDQDEDWQARFHQVRGLMRKDRGELMEAYRDLTLAYEIFQRKTGHLKEEADARAELAIVRHELRESGRSPMRELRVALKVQTEFGCPKGEATTLGYMGRVLCDQGETADALKHSREALAILRGRLKDRRGVAAMHEQIGMIQLKSRHAEEAEKSFGKACEIYRTDGDCRNEACSLACRGVAKFLSGDEDAARRLWKRGRELGKRARCHTSQSLNLRCLAGADAWARTMPDALAHLKEAIELEESAPLPRPRLELVRMIWENPNPKQTEPKQGGFCEETSEFYELVADRAGWGDLAKKLYTRCCSAFAPF